MERKRVAFLLDDKRAKMLDQLVERSGLNVTSTLTALVVEAHKREFPHLYKVVTSAVAARKEQERLSRRRNIGDAREFVDDGYYYLAVVTGPKTIEWLSQHQDERRIRPVEGAKFPSQITEGELQAWIEANPPTIDKAWPSPQPHPAVDRAKTSELLMYQRQDGGFNMQLWLRDQAAEASQ